MIPELTAGFYVFSRLAGLLAVIPVLGARGVPRLARLAAALPLTVVILPAAGVAAPPESLSALALGIATEVGWGLLLGFMAQVAFSALAVGADLASSQSGLQIAAMVDPVSNTDSGAMGALATWLGTGVFLGAGVHLALITILAESFDILPPGGIADLHVAALLPRLAADALATGVMLAGPLTLFTFLCNMCLSVLSRLSSVQQLFMAFGQIVQVCFGLVVFAIALPTILRYWLVWLATCAGMFRDLAAG